MIDDEQTHSLPDDEPAASQRSRTFLGYRRSGRLRAPTLLRHAAPRRGPLRRAVRGGAEPRRPRRQPGLHRHRGRSRHAGDPARARASPTPAGRRRHRARLASRPLPRHRSARARELLTELMPRAAEGAWRDRRARRRRCCRFDDFLGSLPAGVQLFSLFKSNPACSSWSPTSWAARRGWPRSSPHAGAARRRADAGFFDRLPPREALTARADADARPGRRRAGHRSTPRGAGPTTAASRSACSCCSGISRRREPAPPLRRRRGDDLGAVPRVGSANSPRPHGSFRGQRLAVLALGKLGSREMTATSDLDLIFVYDMPAGPRAPRTAPQPLGADPVLRAAQRSASSPRSPRLTGEGALYEVDMRLRPSGNAGPLALSSRLSRATTRQAAWTWEHMALTRARVIPGPPALVERLRGDHPRHAAPAARPRRAAARRRRHARPDRPRTRRPRALGLQAPARRAVRRRLHRPVPALRHAATTPDILDPHPAEVLRRAAGAGLFDRADAERLSTPHAC